MLGKVWKSLKVTRYIRLGPIAFVFKFERRTPVRQGVQTPIRLPTMALPSKQKGVVSAAIQPIPHGASDPMRPDGCAVIVGVGPGFGYAMARLLAAEGFDTVLVSRNTQRLAALVSELTADGFRVSARAADASDELSVAKLFRSVHAQHGTPELVVYAVQDFGPGLAVEVEVPAFEASWRNNCLGAFLVGRSSARLMQDKGSGTIVFVGSTSSLIGRDGHLNLAVGKFGQRALAQVMARELWPQGIHVAHAVVDADIAELAEGALEPRQSDPRHIASAVLGLHRQPRTAWTSELDLRPWNESFWEHC